ncbi:MAG: glucuronate isomerase [Planctomycetota bacterium]
MLDPQSAGDAIQEQAKQAIASQTVWDLHTHLYPPAFGTPLVGAAPGRTADAGGLMLWGIDELLTYHYLIAEFFRAAPRDGPSVEAFWGLTKPQQADLIWQHLFRQRAPLSEACRGVAATLTRLGLDPHEPTPAGYRKWFAAQTPDTHTDRVMELAGVGRVTMTNDVFDENERTRWLKDPSIGADSRFRGVVRLDPMLLDWPAVADRLNAWGYRVDAGFGAAGGGGQRTIDEGRRFLREWIARVQAVYCAASLPPTFRYPCSGSDARAAVGQRVLREIVLPECEAHGLPLALMVGVARGVNPAIRLAGDNVGPACVESVAALCRDFPRSRFLVTMLARENQHALAVTARKFANLMPFGCWWFLNTPSLIEETTRMRMELLGTSFIPQHSDARVLEQLIYKWDHSRQAIGRVLADKHADLAAAGYRVSREHAEQDAHALLWGNTADWLGD